MNRGTHPPPAERPIERLQAQLQQQQELADRFRLLFEHAPDGITLIDPYHPTISWPIVECNRAYCQMNGYSREELIGASIDIVHSGPEQPTVRTAYFERLRREGTISLEVPHYRKDGSIFLVEASTRLISLNGRELVLGVDRDITNQKEAEDRIRRYADELQARNKELDAFAHTIAHDLRAPLSNIIGYVSLMKSDLDDDQGDPRQMLREVDSISRQMLAMIDSMLLFASLRRDEEIREPVSVNEVVQIAVNRLSRQLETRCVQIDVQPDLPDVQGYAPWLEEVFTNLLDNAIKYAGADNPCPTIHIGGQRQPDGMVRMTVADNGIGIPPDKQDQVFDMFTRFSRGTAQGSGLGLSIVGRIVARLGGETGVESSEGLGSTFWFTLPAA